MSLKDKITQSVAGIIENLNEGADDGFKFYTVKNEKTGQVYHTTKYKNSASYMANRIRAAGGVHVDAKPYGHTSAIDDKGTEIKEDVELNEGWDDHLDPDDSVSASLGKNDAKYKAQTFAKGRVHKGTYGGAYNPDEEGEVKDSNPTPTSSQSVSSFNTGSKVKISAAYGKANFKNGIRHTAPHEVISTNNTHARVKNLTKGTVHDVPLAHLSAIGKKGRPTTASSGGDKSVGKWDTSKIQGAPSWLGLSAPLKSKAKAKKVTFDESVEIEEASAAAMGRHADLDFSGHYDRSESPVPSGHTHELVHNGKRIGTGSPDSLLKKFNSGNYPGAKIKKILAEGEEYQDGDIIDLEEGSDSIQTLVKESVEINLEKIGNVYKYALVLEGEILAEGFAATLNGAERMAERYLNTFIAEAEEYESSIAMTEEAELTTKYNVLEVAKKIGAKG